LFRVSIFNNGIQTIIHEPTADEDAPHVLCLPFKESLSQAEQLSFSIPYGNPGYGLVKGLITKVKMIDTNNGAIIFFYHYQFFHYVYLKETAIFVVVFY
jgi:hypothetical protein